MTLIRKMTSQIHRPVLAALGAAVLFGASTPFAKGLVGGMSPMLLAGLLYVGSGLGLTMIRLLRDRGWHSLSLPPGEWRWLVGAILFGGVLGPVLLMVGLLHTTAATSSLLLNFEAVLTALIAWTVFKENAGRRVVIGMALIVAGGAILSWPSADHDVGRIGWGPMAVAGACLCWAIDNNLTRKVSASDPLLIAASKGLIAGIVNTSLAFAIATLWPGWGKAGSALLVGLVGYGFSLVLFVTALRGLGAARTGAYFSTAPFVGAVLSILILHESVALSFWVAGIFMAVGVWLHVSERHEHEHRHEETEHSHSHKHDEHHQHTHASPWDGVEPHEHLHTHRPVVHKHRHFPDIHHRHGHNRNTP